MARVFAADLPFEMVQINRPVLGFIQFIGRQRDAAEPRDVVEQRIGRLRCKDFIARLRRAT